MRKMILFCLLAVMIASCSDKKRPVTQTHAGTAEKPVYAGSDFYRRYSGTVAGQPVVVHLQRVGNEISGSYYYIKQGKAISLYNADDTTSDANYLLSEVLPGSYDGNYAHWDINLTADGIKGKWISADGKKEYPVQLTEQYPAGSYRMEVKNFEASRPLIEGKEEPFAHTSTAYVVPAADVAKEDAAFILSVVRKELGCDTVSRNIDDCIHKNAEAYLQDYRSSLPDMDTSDLASPMNNYSAAQTLRISYNDNGLLVLENFNSGYTGGAHGNYGSSYTCADVKEHRIWTLEDILTVDSNVLKPLLAIAARDYFGLGLKDKLSDRMLVEEVPVTGNIFISEKGISFSYSPYEIASYADGEVVLFITYDKLKALLTPAFIARMHLQQGSGVAVHYDKVASGSRSIV